MDGILTHLALLIPAFSLPSAPAVLSIDLLRTWNAPLPLIHSYEFATSVICLAPVHLRRSVTRLVSYYALFKGWLLLSQHPYTDCSIYIPNIRSLITLSTARCRHHVFSALPSGCSTRTLGLNLFRGEPAISEFDWNFTASHKSSAHVSGYVGSVLQNFTASHKSSAHVSGYVGSVLQFVLPNLQPAHG